MSTIYPPIISNNVLSFEKRVSSRVENYKWPRDQFVEETFFRPLKIIIIFGLLVEKSQLGNTMDRSEALKTFLEIYLEYIEMLTYLKENYQREVFEDALSQFLKLHFMLNHREYKRLIDLYDISRPSLSDSQRQKLYSVLPEQIESRSEKIEVDTGLRSSRFESYYKRFLERVENLLLDTLFYEREFKLDTYSQEKSDVISRYQKQSHFILELIKIVKEAHNIENIEELPWGELIMIQQSVAVLVKSHHSDLIDHALETNSSDKFMGTILQVLPKGMRPEGVNSKLHMMDKINSDLKALSNNMKELYEIHKTLSRIVPQEEREPLPNYLDN